MYNTLYHEQSNAMISFSPSTFKIIETEVKQHSGELLNGFLSLVGDAFDFESSDMKTQLNKFKQNFDVEKLKKVVEDIFGLGSVVVSQLQKNSTTVEDRIKALIDIVLSDSGSARKKRSIEDQPETVWNSGCTTNADNSSMKKRCLSNPENQEGESNEKKDHRVRKFPSSKKNKDKTKEQTQAHPKKDTDYITPGVKFRKRADIAADDIQTQNDGSETIHLDSVVSDSISIIQEELNQHDTLDYKSENGSPDGVPIQESDKGLLDSLIPDSKDKENDNEQKQDDSSNKKSDNGLLDDTLNQKSDKGLLDSLIPDSKDKENDNEQKQDDSSNQKSDNGLLDDTLNQISDKGLLDSLIPDNKDKENDNEQKQDDSSTQKSDNGLLDGTLKQKSDKGLLDSLIPDSKDKEDDNDGKHRYALPSYRYRSSKGLLSVLNPDNRKQPSQDTVNDNDDARKDVRERLRNLGVLSQEFVEELLDLSQINLEVMESKAMKAMGAMRDNMDISRARAFDFFNIYGNYLSDIFDRNAEKIRTIFSF